MIYKPGDVFGRNFCFTCVSLAARTFGRLVAFLVNVLVRTGLETVDRGVTGKIVERYDDGGTLLDRDNASLSKNENMTFSTRKRTPVYTASIHRLTRLFGHHHSTVPKQEATSYPGLCFPEQRPWVRG